MYETTAHGPIGLTGQLVLDGQNNPNAVFIFQTGSTLITGSGSTIALIKGASECNVFWQIGSSATLATNSFFVGNILALTSISVQTGAVVHGRALARNGAVTLDNNVFTAPDCTPTTASAPPATTPSTIAGSATTAADRPTDRRGDRHDSGHRWPATTAPPFVVTDITLPRTGTAVGSTPLYGAGALVLGAAALVLARRRRPAV